MTQSSLGALPNDGSNHPAEGVYVPGSGVVAQQAVLLTTGGDGQPVAVPLVARPGRVLYTSAQAITANGNSATIDVSEFSEFAFDVVIAAPVGGTSPTITFFIDRVDGNGNFIAKYTGTAQTGAGTVTVDIGAGMASPTNVSLGTQARIRWVVVSNATWNVQISLIGK